MILKNNLIIYQSNKNIDLPDRFKNSIIYKIGSGKINNLEIKNVNNDSELNNLAEFYRDDYVDWIYEQNKLFLQNKIIFKKASLFFYTDFSAKRTELSNTFNYFINTKQIEKILLKNEIKKITFIDCDKNLISMINSIDSVNSFEILKVKKNKFKFLFIKTLIYFSKAFLIALKNSFRRIKHYGNESKIFVSRYPLHFTRSSNEEINEDKYMSMVDSDQKYAVSILTDDFHQKVSILNYFKLEKELDKKRFYLMDKHISLINVCFIIITSLKIYKRWNKLYKNQFIFSSILMTDSIKYDLNFSFHRTIRLMLLYESTKNFFSKINADKVIYYLHEYPYGRMITAVLKKLSIDHTAIQHGPSSHRKLVYFLSNKETDQNGNLYNTVPLPNQVLAEDIHSMNIYNYSKYKNVQVMKKIYRLDYLNKIKIKSKSFILIAPGLHDGNYLLSNYFNTIKKNTNEKFLIKPHPRANNSYLKKFKLKNLIVSHSGIDLLLSEAKKVVCTYSSVGYEAKLLGLEVEMININGIINESPLGDNSINLTR